METLARTASSASGARRYFLRAFVLGGFAYGIGLLPENSFGQVESIRGGIAERANPTNAQISESASEDFTWQGVKVPDHLKPLRRHVPWQYPNENFRRTHEILSDWGSTNGVEGPGHKRTYKGARYKHEGVDLDGPSGSIVTASLSGIASHYDNIIGGNVIQILANEKLYILDPGTKQVSTMDLLTVHAHLSERFDVDGKEVKVGDPIGVIGSSGETRTRHLHWSTQVKSGGTAVNPDRIDVNPHFFYAKGPGIMTCPGERGVSYIQERQISYESSIVPGKMVTLNVTEPRVALPFKCP